MATDDEEQAAREAEDRKIAAELGCDAKLYIRYAAEMTEAKKMQIAEWLRNHATDLLASGHEYAELYTGRFNPQEGRELN